MRLVTGASSEPKSAFLREIKKKKQKNLITGVFEVRIGSSAFAFKVQGYVLGK
jgi:hypothetical protein